MLVPTGEAVAVACPTTPVLDRRPTVIDLFAGVGGLSLGAARAGFRLALAVEWDKHAISAHELNFPNSAHSSDDISGMTGARLLELAGLAPGELDGLIGGPPCQGFSVMGEQDVEDPRNLLFAKFFELVSQSQPKFFVAENVPNILNPDYDDIRDAAFNHVRSQYTLLNPFKIKASEFGAPTTRERVFFIGYLPEFVQPMTIESFTERKVAETVTVTQALRGLPVQIDPTWQTELHSWRAVVALGDSPFEQAVMNGIPEGVGDETAIRRYREENIVSGCFGTRHCETVQQRYAALLPGQQDKTSKAVRLQAEGLCPTLRAGTGPDKGSYQAVRPIHPTEARVITPREAARLQGFPDWFQFAPTKWHSFRQIGNSVSPIVAKTILDVIQEHLLD